MMTSVSNDRSRGAREKPQISVTQTTQLQKQVVQATAEQMRLAQVIFDKNDSEFEAKVKQLMEVTGKNQDECIVALHDCNGDVNKAINILLEGNSDTTSWETVGGKKKNFGKDSSQQNSTSPPTTTSSWDLKPSASQSSVLSHFDFKSQPEPSPVLSQLSQRQQHQTQAVSVPPPGLEPFPSQVKLRESAPRDSSASTVHKLLQLPSMTVENMTVSAHPPQPKHVKLPKRRMPPASKIPASAVEMPGSADVTGLNVQFGALEFGSEPSLSEFGSVASSETSSQIPISLYSKSLSDSLNTSLPMTSAVQNSTYTTSVITSSSLTSSSLSSTSPVTTSSSYDQSSVHNRIAYQSSVSPSESAPGTIANGHGGSRSQQTIDSKYVS
uniref:Ubiquitin associated protein 2 n=1 Tax=Sus scrofa TaxID=9823 RepID=A0A8D1NNW5_PIG